MLTVYGVGPLPLRPAPAGADAHAHAPHAAWPRPRSALVACTEPDPRVVGTERRT